VAARANAIHPTLPRAPTLIPARPPADARAFLATTALFGGLDDEALTGVLREAEWFVLPAGATLFREGDAGDSMYLVVSGRLQVVIEATSGGERTVLEVGRGGNIGELALLTGEPRSATVRALRDTELMRLSAPAFTALLRESPAVTRQLTRLLATWVRSGGTARAGGVVTTVAVVPAHREVHPGDFTARLAAALAAFGPTAHVDAARVNAALGEGAASALEGDAAYARTAAWLNRLEAEHRFVVFEADLSDPAWTRRCVRQADRVLVIGSVDAPARADALVAAEGARPYAIERTETLVMLRSADAAPHGTAAWLALRPFADVHHVRRDVDADFARLARYLAGTAVALVLSGGGARGFAHIGVIRALHTAGVPIDRIAGTSMGAIIGALCALGRTPDEMLELSRAWERLRPDREYTVPLVSVMRGRRVRLLLEQMFGDARIEDLPVGYFCVSANLTRAVPHVHRQGLLTRATAASCALPGVLPPVVTPDGELLVDGGILDNMPVERMRTMHDGPIIAVDVSGAPHIRAAGEIEPNPWLVLRRAGGPDGRERAFPSIVQILERAAVLGSFEARRRAPQLADLALRPPVGSFALRDWAALELLARTAYDYALPLVTGWQAQREQCAAPAAEAPASGAA